MPREMPRAVESWVKPYVRNILEIFFWITLPGCGQRLEMDSAYHVSQTKAWTLHDDALMHLDALWVGLSIVRFVLQWGESLSLCQFQHENMWRKSLQVNHLREVATSVCQAVRDVAASVFQTWQYLLRRDIQVGQHVGQECQKACGSLAHEARDQLHVNENTKHLNTCTVHHQISQKPGMISSLFSAGGISGWLQSSFTARTGPWLCNGIRQDAFRPGNSRHAHLSDAGHVHQLLANLEKIETNQEQSSKCHEDVVTGDHGGQAGHQTDDSKNNRRAYVRYHKPHGKCPGIFKHAIHFLVCLGHLLPELSAVLPCSRAVGNILHQLFHKISAQVQKQPTHTSAARYVENNPAEQQQPSNKVHGIWWKSWAQCQSQQRTNQQFSQKPLDQVSIASTVKIMSSVSAQDAQGSWQLVASFASCQ